MADQKQWGRRHLFQWQFQLLHLNKDCQIILTQFSSNFSVLSAAKFLCLMKTKADLVSYFERYFASSFVNRRS